MRFCAKAHGSVSNLFPYGVAGTETVDYNHHKADQRKQEGKIDCGKSADGSHVDDCRLKRRQNRSAENRHDQSGGAEFGIVAKTFQRDSVDGREHQRHACGNRHQTVHSEHILEYDCSRGEESARDRQNHQQFARIQIPQQERADEAAQAEDYHGVDVVSLRKHLGGLLVHSHAGKQTGAVLDDEGPAHNLRSDVEELCKNPFPVPANGENPFQSRNKVDIVRLIVVRRIFLEQDQEKERQDHDPDQQIRADQDGKIGIFDGFEFRIGKRLALGGVQRTHPRLNEVHGDIHPEKRSHRIERLRQIQTTGRGLFRSHRKDVGIRACLQKGESACQDEIRKKERIVIA